MQLLNLANELLLLIAENLERAADLNSLLRANHHLKELLNSLLTSHMLKHTGDMLIWAAQKGNEDMIKLLLDNGANIEHHTYPNYTTPLMEAAEKGHPAVVKLLIERGADIFREDISPSTAIELGISGGCMPAVVLLLDAGASPEGRSRKWRGGLLAQAVRRKHLGIVELLLDRGARPESRELYLAANVRSEDWAAIVKLLLERGVEISGWCWTTLGEIGIAREDSREEIIAKICLYDKRTSGSKLDI